MIKLLEYEDTLPSLSSSENESHERIRSDRKSGRLVACIVVEALRIVALFTSTILAGLGFYNMGKQAQQGSLEIGLFVGIFLSFLIASIVLFTSHNRKILSLPTLLVSLTLSFWLHTEGVLSLKIEWSMAFPVFLIVILALLGASGFVFSALFFNQFYDYEITGTTQKERLKDSLLKVFFTFIKPESLIFFFFMVSTSVAIIMLDGHSFTANLLAFFHTEHTDKSIEDDAVYKSLNSQLVKLESSIEIEKKAVRSEKTAVFQSKKNQNLLSINAIKGKTAPKADKLSEITNLKKTIQSDSITAITEIAKGEQSVAAKYNQQLTQLRTDIQNRTRQINDANIKGKKLSEDNKSLIESAGYGFAKFNEPFFIFLTFVSLHFRRRLAFRLVSKMKLNQGSIIGRMFYTLKIAFARHIHTFIQEWDKLLLGDEEAAKLESINITSLDFTPSPKESSRTVSSDFEEATIRIWSEDDAEKYFRAKLLKTFERGYKPLEGIADHKKATRIQSNKNNQARFKNLLDEMEANTGWTIEIDHEITELSMTDNGEYWSRPAFHLKVKKLTAIA